MKRRELLSSAAAVAAFIPFGGVAQPSQPMIGYLGIRSPETETPLRAPFLEGLENAGFVDGRNVTIEYRFAEGRAERLPILANELIRLPVAVLIAPGVSAAIAAKNATSTIPIVFGVGGDPVQLGLVASLNRPAGNATGVYALSTQLTSKRLEVLRELLPQPGLIAVLFGPDTQIMRGEQRRELDAAAQAVGQPILVLQAQDQDEVEKAFAMMAERGVGGLFFGLSAYFQVIADKLVALAAHHRIPALYEWREFVIAGGLISYNGSRREGWLLAGDYAGRILKGATPADLPVVQSTRFELVINLETAKALGLTIPHTVLLRADEVIE